MSICNWCGEVIYQGQQHIDLDLPKKKKENKEQRIHNEKMMKQFKNN